MAYYTTSQAGTVNVPSHILPSQYAYNTLNKVSLQKTPDADTSKFWYDRIGRLIVSRDGRQKPLKKNSYTQYDALGRVIEVGEITKATPDSLMTDLIARDSLALATWLNVPTKEFITRTFYDDSTFYLKKPLGVDRQDNLRNRVASTTIRRNYNGGVDSLYDYATHYSYDVTGNVKTLIQDIKELQVYNQRFKRMDYNYDQLSGKVNAVFYQRDSVDQFAHFYKYDADNRLTEVSTSTQINTYYRASSQSIWRFTEATYDYYKHGPLARTELGTMRVQGMDYAYTLQGWLKGVNGIVQTTATDMGQDGLSTNASRKYVGRDAYGFVLNYYTNDYKAAGTTSFDPDVTAVTKSNYYNAGQQLFNGNIRSMTVAIKKFGNANGYVYGYDQLNRIKKMDTWNNATAGALPSTWTLQTAYQERVAYDPNGNIKTYTRNANTGVLMDNLAYNYYTGTNRLSQVTDGVAAASFTTDIDNQTNASNYTYDGSGNLISDASESLAVTWSPYGKVLDATRTGIKTLYSYDAMQNRVVKTFIQATDTTRSFYIRDAQGNTMAVYTRRLDTIKWTEQHLYGSSRLGIWEPNQRLTPSVDTTKKWQIREGQKRYELTNHLGNVLVTVNDRRKGTDTNADTFFDVYDGVEITATDYYPFGLEMPGRTFQATAYRYGFNEQETSPEIAFGHYTAQYWEYDSRIGRRWNIDPVVYPQKSGYSTFNNNPVYFTDFLGLYGSKGKAERARAKAQKVGNEVGEVYQSGKEWGFYRYDPSKARTKDKDGSDYSGGHEFKKNFFGSFFQKVGDFFNDINPVKSAEFYVGGVIKMTYNTAPAVTAVIPYGGGQATYSTTKGGSARVITAADAYVNLKASVPIKGLNYGLDVRTTPLSGLININTNNPNSPYGDYVPGDRFLFTFYQAPVIVPVGDVPVPIGDIKIQGDLIVNKTGVDVGFRGVAETIKVRTFSIEFSAGARSRLELPDFFKD